MKLKSYEELKNTNLKGYCYYKDAWSMTRTSRNTYEPELWIVLEDDGNECIVAECGHETWTNKLPKDIVCRQLVTHPAIDSKTYANLIK